MSRAFVKGQDENPVEEILERPISPHKNYVTPEGLAAIEAALESLREAHAAARAADDKAALARIARDERYWEARRVSAHVVDPPTDHDEVRFGARVTIKRGGKRETWRIVGEDEADPDKGSIAYVAPLARALIGKSEGDVARMGDAEVEIVEIR